MKMLLLTSSFPRSGRISGMFIPDTIRHLNKLGVDVHVLTQNCDSPKTHHEELWPGCRVTYFGWGGGDTPLVSLFKNRGPYGLILALQYFLRGFRAGRSICRKWKPDILFAEWLIPAGLLARLLSFATKTPYCCRALGSDVYVAAENALLMPIIKNVAKNSSLLFADGLDLCERTSALADGKPCHFAATARYPDDKRSDFSFADDSNRFTFCLVGRLHPVKGQDILIRACDILRRKGAAFRCYLVGSGDEKNNLAGLIERYSIQNDVILTGHLEDGDITYLLQKVDSIVIPSRSESIPMIMLEAVNAGKPLILTNVGDMGFLARKYNLGYIIPPEDYDKLAEALVSMSDSKTRDSFYDKARYEELATILSVENGAKTIYEKIKELLHKR
ncbi:MAG TPA: glycosyltransferase [Smithella sp.]|nr:glycosyltransferase [Smithella sp.]